jgi:hypothetical protein
MTSAVGGIPLPESLSGPCRRSALGLRTYSLRRRYFLSRRRYFGLFGVCVFITAGPVTKLFAGGGGGEWRTCAMIDDEPRTVWMSPLITRLVFRLTQFFSEFLGRRQQACQSLAVYYTSLVQT